MKGFIAAAILGGATFCGATINANAAPVGPAPIQANALVEKVHGYHRSCRGGAGWVHRHTRSGRPAGCGPRLYRRPGVHLYFGGRDRRGHYHRHHHRRHDRHHRRRVH